MTHLEFDLLIFDWISDPTPVFHGNYAEADALIEVVQHGQHDA